MPLAEPAIIQNPQRLESLRNLCLLDSPADPAFDRLTRLASRIMEVPVSLVTLVDAHRQFFKSSIGLDEPWATMREMPLTHSFCQHVVASGEPLIMDDAREHPLVYDNPAIEEMNAIAYAGMPLTTSDGYTLGSFCVVDSQPRHWNPGQLEILADLAHSVMTEIELRSQMFDLEKAEAELLQTYLHVSELEQLKTDMINMAAHDLKNPLAAVLGASSMLIDSEAISESDKGLVEMIDTAGHHMQRIIGDVLSLHRIENQEFAFEDCNLTALVRKRFEHYQTAAKEKQIQFRLDLPKEDIHVSGDTIQLREAIDNLIGNALKYTPAERSVTVRLSLPKADEVLFEVVDTGYGIPDDMQERLFQPFYRAKTRETRKIEGTGLGLHLVKNVITRMKGEMHFHSVYGQGSTFGFTMPTVPAHVTA